MKRFIVMCGAALLAIGVLVAVGINAGEPAKTIRVIYTNDTQGYIDPCG